MITSAVSPTPPEAGPGRPHPVLAVERGGPDPRGARVRCLVTWPGELPLLADVVPVFEQLGVRVADHYPLDRDRGEPGRGARDGFEVILPEGRGDGAGVTALESAFAAAWSGDTELDGLSRLVLTAGIPWRQVALQQAGLGLSSAYVEETVRGLAGLRAGSARPVHGPVRS